MDTCFVVMPISTSEAYVQRYNDVDHFKHVLDDLFTPALKLVNYEVIPPAAAGSDLIHAEIIRNLEESNLVLCDISTLNPNVFFELGIRTSIDRPVVLVRDNLTTQIPFDTGSINTYTYEASLQPWILDNQLASLARHITEAEQRSEGRNSLWRYFGLTQRATPATIANPTEAKLDLVVQEVTRLTKMVRERSRSETDQRTTNDEAPAIAGGTFGSSGVSAKQIIAKVNQGTLTEIIPVKYAGFLAQVDDILNQNNARASRKMYDEEDDVLFLDTSRYVIYVDQLEQIAEAAEMSSAKYVIKVENPYPVRIGEDK